MLVLSTKASNSSVSPSSAQNRSGETRASQSTMRPRKANSSASKAPMAAVNTVMAAM